MGKDRRGASKNGPKSKQTVSKPSRIAGIKKAADMQRDAAVLQRLKEKLAAKKRLAPKKVQVSTGRAVALAHGAGGSSAHSSMKAWRARLGPPLCDEVAMVDFPRPYTLSTQCAAYAEAVRELHAQGHTRIVLAGVAIAPRAALHLLTGLGGDDEADGTVEPLPAELAGCVVGVLGLGYALLVRGASGEESAVRDGALRALTAGTPPVLLALGSDDKTHVDRAALDAAIAAGGGKVQLHVVEGAGASLKVAEGTHAGKEAEAALDLALETFLGATLGSAEANSALTWRAATIKESVPTGKEVRALESAARQLEIEAMQQENAALQLEAKKRAKEERREAADAARAAKRAKAVPDLVFVGCGEADINGTYRCDGVRDGVPCYKQVGGRMTIERDSAPDQATQWCLCDEYGFASLAFADCDDDTPPADGWLLADGLKAPPPEQTAESMAASVLAAKIVAKVVAAADSAPQGLGAGDGVSRFEQGCQHDHSVHSTTTSRSHQRGLAIRKAGKRGIKAKGKKRKGHGG